MKSRDGITQPIWYDASVTVPTKPQPGAEAKVDVCVVGAGISGLTSAYLLAGEGKRVLVLDEGEIGSGQTGRTSAHLASANDDLFTEIERVLGEEAVKLSYESHAAAIDLIETIARDESIECDFHRVDALLFLAEKDSPKTLEKELAAAHRARFVTATRDDTVRVGNRPLGPAIRFPNQASFQPMQYLVGLAAACEKRGVVIRIGKRVIDVTGAKLDESGNVTEPAQITLEDDSKLEADHVIVATNTPTPINDWAGIYTKQASYRTYMVGLKVPEGSVADVHYSDTLDPYHYARLHRTAAGESVLLVGGEDHKVGQAGADDQRFDALADWTREVFPMAGDIVSRWSGQVQEPADGVAFIGVAKTKNHNVYVITGDSGMGLTHGTLGAKLITDLIHARENPWTTLYDPGRKERNREFLKENLNTAAQYTDFLTPGEVKHADDVPTGEGALLRSGLSKLAVYKDDAGVVHTMSAVCTHLGCIVHWNGVEKSWDCPCHGSRFDPTGKVVMGPAVEDLKKSE